MLFKISIKNIILSFKKNKLLMIMMMLAFVVSLITLIYVIVKLDCGCDILDNSKFKLSRITLDNRQTNYSIDELISYANKYNCNYKDYKVKKFYGYIQSPDIDLACVISNEQKYFDDIRKSKTAYKGRMLTSDEISNGSNVFVTCNYFLNSDSINIDGHKLSLVGCMPENDISNGFIPLNTVKKNQFELFRFCIEYNKDINLNDFKSLKKDIEKAFPDMDAKNSMEIFSTGGNESLNFDNLCLILMSVVSVFACGYMYVYIIQRRIRQIKIMKICGATPFDNLAIMMGEVIIIAVSQIVFSFLIFRFVLVNFLDKYDVCFSYGWSIKHILLGSSIMLGLMLLIFIPSLFFFCRMNPIKLKKYEKR